MCTGFLAKLLSWTSRSPSSISAEEADIYELYNMVQDKTAEFNALKSKPATSKAPPTPIPDATNNTPANSLNNKPNNNSTVNISIPQKVLDQVKKRIEMKAAGVAPDKLPKLDLSGIPPETLKQIYKAYQQTKPPNTKDTLKSDQIK